MKNVYAGEKIINLGYAGETLSEQVIFNMPCDWDDGGEIKVYFTKPGNVTATEYDVEISENLVYWVIDDSVTKPGYGNVQLVMTKPGTDEIIKKSKIFTTVCKKSLEKAGN